MEAGSSKLGARRPKTEARRPKTGARSEKDEVNLKELSDLAPWREKNHSNVYNEAFKNTSRKDAKAQYLFAELK